MFYDRPKKKKRPPEAVKQDTEPKNEQEASGLARKNRFSFFRFFFLTPNREKPQADDGYAAPEYGAQKPKKRRLVLKAAALLVGCALLMGLLLYVLPVGMFGSRAKSQFCADNQLPKGYVHVLLIGVDIDGSGTSRSDTMMIVSVARGDVKLTSIQRDTGVTIPGRSGTHRLNAAYAYGGAELLLQTINQNFGLDITRYALVDYDSFPKIIDKLGGISVRVSDNEVPYLNKNLYDLLLSDMRKGRRTYDECVKVYDASVLEQGGDIRMNGAQALAYARIRQLDSDYARTNRQRKIMAACVSRAKELLKNPFRLTGAAAEVLYQVTTNMNTLEILSIAVKAAGTGIPEQTRIPVNGTYVDDGGMFKNVDYAANHSYFIEFVYGKQ